MKVLNALQLKKGAKVSSQASSTALNCTLEYLFENSPDKTLTTFGIIG
tara:strand:+ start:452 stop:595 length:144 start_codon:yes stop_codon:yes gene_type:complete